MPEHKELEKSIYDVKQLKRKAGFTREEVARLHQITTVHPMRISP